MKFCPPLLGTSPCYWWINNATAPVTHFVAGEACLINDRTLLDEKKELGHPNGGSLGILKQSKSS